MRIGKKKARKPACKLVGGKLVLRNHNRKETNLGVERVASLYMKWDRRNKVKGWWLLSCAWNDKSTNVLKPPDANDDRKEQDEKLMTAGGLKWETGGHQDSLAQQLQCNSNLGSTEGCALQSFAIQTRSSALITLHTRQKKVWNFPTLSSFFIESFYHPA